MGELSMYKITRIYAAEIEHGKQLRREGKRDEALEYIREHTEVPGEFDSYLEARQYWTELGMPAGANYHATDGAIYRLDVAHTY